MQQLLDEQTAQLACLKESQDLVRKQEEDLESMQHELNDATNLALSAQRQLDEAHLEIHKLKEWNCNAKNHHESEIGQIRLALEASSAQALELNSLNSLLNQKLQTSQAQQQEGEKQLYMLKDSINTLINECEELKVQLATSAEENTLLKTAREKLVDTIEAMSKLGDELRAEIQVQTEEKRGMVARISELESTVGELRLGLEESERRCREFEECVESFRSEMGQLEGEKAALEGELAKWQEEVQILTETHVKALEERDLLEQRVGEQEAEVARLQGEAVFRGELVEAMRQEKEALVGNAGEASARVYELEQRVVQAEIEMEGMRSEYEAKFESRRVATEELLATRKAEFQYLKDHKNEKIEGLSGKLKEANEEIEMLKVGARYLAEGISF